MNNLNLNQLDFEELSLNEYAAVDGGGWVDFAVGILVDNIDSLVAGMKKGFEDGKK